MPDWIPADIRRASLRGQIHRMSPQELKVAETEGISGKLEEERGF